MDIKFIDVVCYLCGYNNFSACDIKIAQVEKTINEYENDQIAYANCPGCGFTIEV